MTRAIGIDIGSRSIKIAEVQVSGNERSITGLSEIPYTEGSSPEQLLRDYFRDNSSPNDRISVGLGAIPSIIKQLSFPFSDRAKVSSAIRADFEDTMPFEIDDYTLDHKLLKKKGRHATFSAGICPNEPLAKLNDIFDKAGLIPNNYLIDGEALGQLALDQCLPVATNPVPYAVCDLGYRGTKISLLQGCRPQNFDKKAKNDPFGAEIIETRQIQRGSADLIDWIQDQKQLSREEAEQWLIHRAEIKSEEGASEDSVSDGLSDDVKMALRPIVVEIYQTLQSFRGKSGRNLAALYVTGGMTRLRGIMDFLSHELRVPVHPWPVFIGFRTDQIPVSADKERAFAVALSLAHRYSHSKPIGWLNFKRSSQAARKVLSNLIATFKDPVLKPVFASMGWAVIGLYAYLIVSTFLVARQKVFLEKELVTEFRRLNRDSGKRAEKFVGDPVRSRQVFEQEKNKILSTKAQVLRSRSQSDLLADASQVVPLNTVLKDWLTQRNAADFKVKASVDFKDERPGNLEKQIRSAFNSKNFSDFKMNSAGGPHSTGLEAIWKGGSNE